MEDSFDNLGILQHPSKNACYSLMHHPLVRYSSKVGALGVQSSYSTCNVAKYYSSEKADKGNRINSTVATNQIELTELNTNSNRQEIPIQH